jgi:hypothetical protein
MKFSSVTRSQIAADVLRITDSYEFESFAIGGLHRIFRAFGCEVQSSQHTEAQATARVTLSQ